jgi:hypothetical protein
MWPFGPRIDPNSAQITKLLERLELAEVSQDEPDPTLMTIKGDLETLERRFLELHDDVVRRDRRYSGRVAREKQLMEEEEDSGEIPTGLPNELPLNATPAEIVQDDLQQARQIIRESGGGDFSV